MTPEYFQALARYNRWINAKVYASSAALTDEDRKRDRGLRQLVNGWMPRLPRG